MSIEWAVVFIFALISGMFVVTWREMKLQRETLDQILNRVAYLTSNDRPAMRIIPQQDFTPKKPESKKMDDFLDQLQGLY